MRPPTTSASSATELFLEAIGGHSETVEGLLHDLGEHRRRCLPAGAVLPCGLVDHDGHYEPGVVDGRQADEAGPGHVGVVAVLVQFVGGAGLSADAVAGHAGVAA